TLELAPHQRVVALEELAPLAVAEPCGEGGRADDVGEEQGGEDAVRLRRGADTGQELLHLTKQGIRFTSPRQGVRARELDQLRARDVLGQGLRLFARRNRSLAGPPPGGGTVPKACVPAVEDERLRADRRQHVPDVDLAVHPQ